MSDIKINHNYFILNGWLSNARYFLRRGHFFPLLWDRFKWHFYPKMNILPDFPLTVDIEASLTCNLKCPMCTRETMKPEDLVGVMDFDLYTKIVDECAEHNIHSLKLSWRGEPTVNRRLADMVRYAKDKGIRDVAFLTNGGLLNQKRIEELVDAGLDWISFSIDGLYEGYEEIRKPNKFEKIVATVKAVSETRKAKGKSKPLIRIQTISTAVDRYPEFYDFWAPYVDRIAAIAEHSGADPSKIVHDPNYVCQSPFQRVFITWDGTVVPCHADYSLHHNLGDAKKQSIQEIWKSEKFEFLRRKMRACERLDFEACRLCPDGGKYSEDEIEVEGRAVPIIRYIGKTDIEKVQTPGIGEESVSDCCSTEQRL